MKPDASLHNPSPDYLRELLKRAGMKQEAAAQAIGMSPRQMRYYLSRAADHQDAPYTVQFSLECLANKDDPERRIRELHAAMAVEAFAARRTLAAVIAAAGGEVSVKRHHIANLSMHASIERWDSPGGDWFFKLKE